MPRVTVLMSVYNAMPYLPAAVDSILAQTYDDFVFLVINDGSTDGSAEYLRGLSDPRIEILDGPHQGLGAALNLGLAHCRTELLARMDADDIVPPRRLQTQMDYLDAHPKVGMVGTQFTYFGEANRKVFSPRMPLDHETIYNDLINGRLAFVHASLMCRTEIMRGIGGYRVEGVGEDWDMFLRMGEAAELANVDEALYLWRIHADSVTISRLHQVQTRIQYACHCARLRREGSAEIPFEDFVYQRRTRPVWLKATETMDLYALAQYRGAMAGLLNAHWSQGYARLMWAAMCSPQRTTKRLYRAFRRQKKTSLNVSTP